MYIYTITTEEFEARENTTAAFQDALLEDSKAPDHYFLTEEEARACYDRIDVSGPARPFRGGARTWYAGTGKVLRQVELYDEDAKPMLAAGEILKDIEADAWKSEDILEIHVSAPCSDPFES